MKKKTIAIIIELIPIISIVLSIFLILSSLNNNIIRGIINITTIISLAGFVFSIIGRKLEKENLIVKILGILDILSFLIMIVFYILAIICFGL